MNKYPVHLHLLQWYSLKPKIFEIFCIIDIGLTLSSVNCSLHFGHLENEIFLFRNIFKSSNFFVLYTINLINI